MSSLSKQAGIRATVLAAVTAMILSLTAVVAYADYDEGYMTVSCDSNLLGSGMTVSHEPTGTFKIRNISSGNHDTRVTARSQSTGNDLQTQIASQGERVSWTGVLAGSYTIKARISGGSQNCNGALPGHGNYVLNYGVTYE